MSSQIYENVKKEVACAAFATISKISGFEFRNANRSCTASGMTQEPKQYFEKPNAVDESQIYEKPNASDIVVDAKDTEILGNALHGLSVAEYDKQCSEPHVTVDISVSSPQATTPSISTPLQTDTPASLSDTAVNGSLLETKEPDTPASTEVKKPDILSSSPAATTSESAIDPVSGFIQPEQDNAFSPSISHKPSYALSSRINTINSTVLLINKHSFLQPQHHDIYLDSTKKICYRKIQPHSYHWGFQNTLYRIPLDKQLEKGTVVAETKRQAYQNQMVLVWGNSLGENKSKMDTSEFKNMTTTTLLFVYEMEYKSRRLRWARPSLLSHNLICELIDGPRTMVAEFDSHGMGYLVHVGKLKMHNSVMAEVAGDDISDLEGLLVISCCTLIDLMREVVEKAVGISNGGVAGSI